MENKTPSSEDLLKQLELEKKRRKDTQAEFTKKAQELARLKAEVEADKKKFSDLDLGVLKSDDPDKYIEEIKRIDLAKKEFVDNKVKEYSHSIKTEEVQNRLEKYLDKDTDIFDYVTPKVRNRFDKGEIDIEYLVKEAKKGGMVTKGSTPPDNKFKGLGNNGHVIDGDKKVIIDKSYEDTIF